MDERNQDNLPTQSNSKDLSCYSGTSTAWRTATLAILNKLALHYWRPDFEPSQFKHLMADYLNDLAAYTPEDIEAACSAFRRKPESKFYPRVGELLAILNPAPDPSDKPPRLPRFTGYPDIQGRRATKSVAEILREHGHRFDAARWDAR